MNIDEHRQKYDELVRGICSLNDEEREELNKDTPDMMTLYQITAEREALEEEVYNI